MNIKFLIVNSDIEYPSHIFKDIEEWNELNSNDFEVVKRWCQINIKNIVYRDLVAVKELSEILVELKEIELEEENINKEKLEKLNKQKLYRKNKYNELKKKYDN